MRGELVVALAGGQEARAGGGEDDEHVLERGVRSCCADGMGWGAEEL